MRLFIQDEDHTCKSCRFWLLSTGEHDENIGECRVNPPQQSPHSPEQANAEKNYWPRTQEDDWCGHFGKHIPYREI